MVPQCATIPLKTLHSFASHHDHTPPKPERVPLDPEPDPILKLLSRSAAHCSGIFGKQNSARLQNFDGIYMSF